MKYMIMLYASQQEFDRMTGHGDGPGWDPAKVAAMYEFMGKWNQDLVESGEFVDANGLDAPVHTRRLSIVDGAPVVTDGPYAETQEVLAGYTIVDCASFDRATEIMARLAACPNPGDGPPPYADLRPIVDGREELEL